jgi:hypothetical protein
VESALVHAVETGLITLEKGHLGRGGEFAEGGRGAGTVRTGRVGVQLTDNHLVLEGAGAAKAPVRGAHFLDQTFLDAIGGAEACEVLVHEMAEAFE